MGVEGDEAAVLEPRERVDLGERHVVVAEELGEAREHRGRAGQLAAGDPGRGDDLLRVEVGDRQQVGEVAAADVVGVLLGDLLDVDAAHVGEEHHRLLAGPVPDDAGVVLLRDLGLRVDEDAARHVAVDLELEDLGGVRLGLLGGVGELDPAGLHPAAGQDLRLDHGRAADLLGGLARLLGGRAEAVLGDRNPGPLDDLPRLVLVETHGGARNLVEQATGGRPAAQSHRFPLGVRGPSRPPPKGESNEYGS